MNAFLCRIDRLNSFFGQLFAWLMVPLTLLICVEVVGRYVFSHSYAWVFDTQIMLYGTIFMMAGAYTLAKSGHVRGDILYGFLSPRAQAWLDLVLYILFFLPGVAALVWAGSTFAAESIAISERSSITADGPPIWPFKLMIPISGALLLLQGLVEMCRCVICIRTGEWPSREQDVEEVDVDKLRDSLADAGVVVGKESPQEAGRA